MRKQLFLSGTRDVRDAAQVPPSVFVRHQGEPQIMHSDPARDQAGHHSFTMYQEQPSGI